MDGVLDWFVTNISPMKLQFSHHIIAKTKSQVRKACFHQFQTAIPKPTSSRLGFRV